MHLRRLGMFDMQTARMQGYRHTRLRTNSPTHCTDTQRMTNVGKMQTCKMFILHRYYLYKAINNFA